MFIPSPSLPLSFHLLKMKKKTHEIYILKYTFNLFAIYTLRIILEISFDAFKT